MRNDRSFEQTQVTRISQSMAKQPNGEAESASPFQTTVAVSDENRVVSVPIAQPTVAKSKDPLLGSRLDTYWIRAVLGHGGMGKVYLAWHERLERLCALKIVLPELVEREPCRLQMFFSEARAAAKFHHPHVVSIHSVGDDRGFHFIEMEYVRGPSLRQLLRDQRQLSPAVATRFIAQIATALASAHQQEIIHCDIKPDNVMIAPGHQAKLADFGLARAFTDGSQHRAVGTPPYMAPEIYCEKPATAASDVYALGVTYYYLLSGRLPFEAYSLSEMRDHHLFSEPPMVCDFVPHVPTEIGNLIRSMLAKAPEERPQCTQTFAQHLHAMANSLIPLESHIQEAIQDLDVQWRKEDGRFVFDVSLAKGRRQTIFAEVIQAPSGAGKLFSFWTPCAPAEPSSYEMVLQMNGRLPFGTISIREFRNRPYFVMVENHSRNTINPSDIHTSLLHLSTWADMLEHDLTGADLH